ncbi:MAG: heavy-metal-associated domain-containing protein [Flavobacteriales bacterium]|jgi:copper chaperone CopZ
MKQLTTIAFVLVSIASFGQKKAETTFVVQGLCGMCEERIEKAFDVPGVINADWDVETKELQVAYKTKKLDENKLHALAAAAGHDTDQVKATDEVYAGLHGCCKYREGASCGDADHDDHDHDDDDRAPQP